MSDPLQEVEKRENKFSMKVRVKGRKTGILRSANFFFVLLDGKIFARTSYTKSWLKNVAANPDVTIMISGLQFKAKAEELNDLAGLEVLKLKKAFRQKYSILDYFVLWFLIRGKTRFVRFLISKA